MNLLDESIARMEESMQRELAELNFTPHEDEFFEQMWQKYGAHLAEGKRWGQWRPEELSDTERRNRYDRWVTVKKVLPVDIATFRGEV